MFTSVFVRSLELAFFSIPLSLSPPFSLLLSRFPTELRCQLSLEAGLSTVGHASAVSRSCGCETKGSPFRRSGRVSPEERRATVRPSRPALLLCAWRSVWSSRVGCRGVILQRGHRGGCWRSLFPPFQACPLHYLSPLPALQQVWLQAAPSQLHLLVLLGVIGTG